MGTLNTPIDYYHTMKSIFLAVALTVGTILSVQPAQAAHDQDELFMQMVSDLIVDLPIGIQEAGSRSTWEADIGLANWYCEQRRRGRTKDQLFYHVASNIVKFDTSQSEAQSVAEYMGLVFAVGANVYCPEFD